MLRCGATFLKILALLRSALARGVSRYVNGDTKPMYASGRRQRRNSYALTLCVSTLHLQSHRLINELFQVSFAEMRVSHDCLCSQTGGCPPPPPPPPPLPPAIESIFVSFLPSRATLSTHLIIIRRTGNAEGPVRCCFAAPSDLFRNLFEQEFFHHNRRSLRR
jgi:hypothetical protein